jgi:hypothetical protein
MWTLRKESLVSRMYHVRWLILGFVAFVVIADPAVSNYIASFFGIARGVDAVVYISIIWIFFKLYSDSNKIEKLEEKIEILTRLEALKGTKENEQLPE